MSLSKYILQNAHIDCPNCEDPIFASDVIDETDYFHKSSDIQCPWCCEKIRIQMTIQIDTSMKLVTKIKKGESNV